MPTPPVVPFISEQHEQQVPAAPIDPAPAVDAAIEQSSLDGNNHISHHVDLDEAILNSLSKEDRMILQEIDMDGSGQVDLTEILGLLRHHRDDKSHLRKLFKAFLFVIVALLVLLGVNTSATFAVVQMAKESKSQGSTMVSASTGKTVATANSEMSVNADGQLVARNTAKSRRLAGAGGAIKTTPSLQKVELASSLPDSILMGLEEVTVHSDKGHTLQVKVQGFSRVPVQNSRCGNIVHFYTAWKGRITLDSTDLSFDDATAQEFENAGFGLAVGGPGGRRLAGKSKTDGFFKNMQSLKESGKWRCAGVPLPTQSATSITRNTNFLPCGNFFATSGPEMCDSSYGGLVPGAGLVEKKHALVVVSKTKRISASISAKTPEVLYVKTSSTVLRSPSYQVTIDLYPAHMGQELISIFDRKSKASVSFQVDSTKIRSHCKVEASDEAADAVQKAEEDSKVDTDMHFELIDTNEEDGVVLRHFRMMASSAFTAYMGNDALKSKDSSHTEYWDVADSLTPYRILSGDGTLTVLNSVTPTCSDADVVAEIKKRLEKDIAGLMTCSEEEKHTTLVRPTMDSPHVDLSTADADYYQTTIFGSQEDTEDLAADSEDNSDKAQFARYLVKSNNKLAMPTWCHEHCKSFIDRLKTALKDGDDICTTGVLQLALTCMEASDNDRCQSNEFVTNHFEECGKNTTARAGDARRLQTVDEDGVHSTMLAVSTMQDGTQVADLSKVDASLLHALAEQTGMESISSARLVFNMTKKTNAMYDKLSLDDAPIVRKRNLISFTCNSKKGKTKWMGDGWCMKWDFKKFGFTLMIKWGKLSGKIGIAISCEACVPILLVFSIPPPLKVEFCVGGELSISAKWACPQIPLTISGKVYWSVSAKADFGVVSINFAKLEMGIFAKVSNYKKEIRCWWICGEGRRRRRRFWSRRRRRTRKCNYKKECDIKVGAYVEITLAIVKAKLDLTYWVRNKELTVNLTIKAYEFWKLFWGGWKKMYSTRIAKYKFR